MTLCYVLLPTAYVVRREGYVLTRVCLSVCPHLGGIPRPGPDGEVRQPGSARGGIPKVIRPGWGVPLRGGTPPQVPPIGPGQGYPCWGGTPPRVADGVLDTPQSVCLLRSRRRTFLLPPASEGWGKVMFSVCSHLGGGTHIP